MSKKNGAIFSRAFSGYKRSDVNEYIRQADEAHAEELSKLKSENAALEERIIDFEATVKKLESELELERTVSEERIAQISEEAEKKLDDAAKSNSEINEKLIESEARATSYLKMADSSALRAESAEAEVAKLSTGLESAKEEIAILKNEKISDSEKIAELQTLVDRYAAQEKMICDQKKRYFIIKRPSFLNFGRKR